VLDAAELLLGHALLLLLLLLERLHRGREEEVSLREDSQEKL